MLKIRKIKYSEGSTSVQVYKIENRKRIILRHIGTAKTPEELDDLVTQFAIKAFRFSALDYLVKPIFLDDLIEAVKKATNIGKPSEEQIKLFQQQSQAKQINKIAVSSLSGIVFICLDDILYVEASSNYSILVLLNCEKVIVSKTLKDVQEILQNRNFFRIHRQYIVNLNKVKFFNKNECVLTMENDKQLRVARVQKDKLIEKFGLV